MKNIDLVYKPEESLKKIYPRVYDVLRKKLPNAKFYLHGSSYFKHIFKKAISSMKKQDALLVEDTYTSGDIDIIVFDDAPFKQFLKTMKPFKPVVHQAFMTCSFGWNGPEGHIIDMWYRRPDDKDIGLVSDVRKFPYIYAQTLDHLGITPEIYTKTYVSIRNWACRQYIWSKRFINNTVLWMALIIGYNNRYRDRNIDDNIITARSLIVATIEALMFIAKGGGTKAYYTKDGFFDVKTYSSNNKLAKVIFLHHTPAITPLMSNRYVLIKKCTECLSLIRGIDNDRDVLYKMNSIGYDHPGAYSNSADSNRPILVSFTPKNNKSDDTGHIQTLLKKDVNPTLKYLFDIDDGGSADGAANGTTYITRPYDYMSIAGRKAYIAIGIIDDDATNLRSMLHDNNNRTIEPATRDMIVGHIKKQIEWVNANIDDVTMEMHEWDYIERAAVAAVAASSPSDDNNNVIADIIMSHTAVGMAPLKPDHNADVESLFDKGGDKRRWTKNAYVYLIMHGDRYTPGVIASAHSIRQTGSTNDIVVMITDDVTDDAVSKLKKYVTRIIRVPYMRWKAAPMRGAKQRDMYKVWGDSAFTKGLVHFLLDYKKVIFVDADMVVTKNCDHLFEMRAPMATFSRREAYPYTEDGLYNPYQHDRYHRRHSSYSRRSRRGGWVKSWIGGVDNSRKPINHGSLISYKTVGQAIKRGWFVMIAAMFMIEPNSIVGRHYLEMVTRRPIYNEGNEPPISAPDEVSICQLYTELKIDWTQLGVIYNWIPWGSEGWLKYTKWTPDDVHVVHFFGTEKPWEMDRNKYDDIKLWWDIYDDAISIDQKN